MSALLALLMFAAAPPGPDWSRATVIDCVAGEVFLRLRDRPGDPGGPVRRLPVRDCPDLPLPAADDDPPAWAQAVARLRRFDRLTADGDLSAAADEFLALARLRPHRAAAFLPTEVATDDYAEFDAAVRTLQSAAAAELSAGRSADAPLAMLARLRFTGADRSRRAPVSALRFAPGATVVWALDAASFDSGEWSAIRRQLAERLAGPDRRAGVRFAIVAGPGRLWRLPADGRLSAADAGDRAAAADFLGWLPHVPTADWAATLRAAATDAILVPVTRRGDAGVPDGFRAGGARVLLPPGTPNSLRRAVRKPSFRRRRRRPSARRRGPTAVPSGYEFRGCTGRGAFLPAWGEP
jgi:hypothetical protein